MDAILNEPWPWYVAGPLIGLMVPILLWMGNRQFGMSASLQDLCAYCVRGRSGFFQFNPEKAAWRLWFTLGVILGGVFLAVATAPSDVEIAGAAVESLRGQGLREPQGMYPQELLGGPDGFSAWQVIYLLVAGILVGFGTRMAGGCTSGHSIMGLAQFSPASLVATIGFFGGGLLMTHLAFPHLLPWLLHA